MGKDKNGKRCVMLFGVNLLENPKQTDDDSTKTSSSLNYSHDENENIQNTNDDDQQDPEFDNASRPSTSQEKGRKVRPWTVEEHKAFLAGLNKIGKGQWKRISRTFVQTKTPTQVASHAQKYFKRQDEEIDKRKRKSVFDMSLDELTETSNNKLKGESETSKALVISPLLRPSSSDSNLSRMQAQPGDRMQLASTRSSDPELYIEHKPKQQQQPIFIPLSGVGYMDQKPKTTFKYDPSESDETIARPWLR